MKKKAYVTFLFSLLPIFAFGHIKSEVSEAVELNPLSHAPTEINENIGVLWL